MARGLRILSGIVGDLGGETKTTLSDHYVHDDHLGVDISSYL